MFVALHGRYSTLSIFELYKQGVATRYPKHSVRIASARRQLRVWDAQLG